MKDFKGSSGDFKIGPCANGGVILYLDKDQQIQIVNEANARLFANSKKVLEAAIGLVKYLDSYSLAGYEKAMVEKLEKAINDSL